MRACVLALLLALGVGLFFWRLGERDLWASHEARAAMNADSVLRTGDALPRLHDGRVETQKPPLYYWLAAGVGWLRGEVDGTAVRLPSALAAVGVLLLAFGLPAALGRVTAGLVASLILASSIHFPWLARLARIDVPLTFTVGVAALAFFVAQRQRSSRRFWLVIAWLACALGVLLKGPLGIVRPAAIVAAWLLFSGHWPAPWHLRAWRHLFADFGVGWGVSIVLAVTVPIFLWLEHRSNGAFLYDFFWLHNVQRGLGGSRLRGHPWWEYVGYLSLYLLPYSPLLLLAFWRRLWQRDELARFGLAWLIGVVVLLSAARFKRADYLLPAYPGAALFLGCVIARQRWLVSLTGVVSACVLVGWAFRIEHLPREEPYRDYRPLAALIRRHESGEVVFFRCEAHALAFRVGRPLRIVVEYPHLRQCVQNGPIHVVVPESENVECHLPGVVIEKLGGNRGILAGGRHERPLLLLRLREPDAGTTTTTADRRVAD